MSTQEVAVEETLINLDGVYRESNIQQILDDLDRELVGLAPVKGASARSPRCCLSRGSVSSLD